MTDNGRFARLVGIACHDLRTPLATVYGFARTLRREPASSAAERYLDMIEAAAGQMTELLEELALTARIEAGTFEPHLLEVDTLELATNAAEELVDDPVSVSGTGAAVRVVPDATRRAIGRLARAARRHGSLASVDVTVDGPVLAVSPTTDASAPVLTGEELRELGAAAAVAVVRAQGGSVELDGERLLVRLPAA
jgi:signal transduction histidine kinase